jgi:hypothetical protein
MRRGSHLVAGAALVLAVSIVGAYARAADVTAGRPAGLRDEVLLSGAADVKALCAELHEGDAEAAAAVYTVALSSAWWSFAPYDGKRARLLVDTQKGFRSPTGAWELAVIPPADNAALALALPASGKEAAQLIRQGKAGELTLWLWFKPAALPKQSGACAEVRGGKGAGVRLGATLMAFALVRAGGEPVASGETQAFAALRALDGPIADPRVEVGKAVLTGEGGNAPDAVSKAAAALAPRLLDCYRRGLDADPELRGTLVVGVVSDATGRVTDARAEIDGLGAAPVSSCVVGKVKAARFPAGDALRFSFSLRFGAAP